MDTIYFLLFYILKLKIEFKNLIPFSFFIMDNNLEGSMQVNIVYMKVFFIAIYILDTHEQTRNLFFPDYVKIRYRMGQDDNTLCVFISQSRSHRKLQ